MNLEKGFLFLVFVFFFGFSAQSQKIIAFDKRGKIKRIKYFQSEFIRLKLKNGKKLEGGIYSIGSNSFFVEGALVHKDSVDFIYNTQKYYGFDLLGKIMLRAGVFYMSIDTFNRLINEEELFPESTIQIGSSFLAVGLVSKLIVNRRYRISEKRPLKIIDLTP